MMLTTDQWVPLEGLHELPLIEALQRAQRAFIKPLKYDARTAVAFPNVLLLDCGKVPLPLHVVSPFADVKERALKEKAVAARGMSAWVWTTDKEMPPLPERARGHEGERGRNPYSTDGLRGAGVADRQDPREHEMNAPDQVSGSQLTG